MWALGVLERLGSLFEAAGLTVAAMGPFVVGGGRVELPIGGHLVTAAAPG